jgi:hypothetical protein
LPPLAEQREILNRVFAAISLIDNLNHQVHHARRRSFALRSSILASAFSGALILPEEPAPVLLQPIALEQSSEQEPPDTRTAGQLSIQRNRA